MAEYVKKEDVLKLLEKHSFTKKITLAYGVSIYDRVKNESTADVVDVEKVAKILVDVTGITPCEMAGVFEWDYDYCNCELCSQSTYEQCWERYLKYLKGVIKMTCRDCIHYDICVFHIKGDENKKCCHFKNKADVVEVVRCKNCKSSSEPKSVSRLELYINNYDVRFCEKEQKIVCGTHFCSYGTPKERGEEK